MQKKGGRELRKRLIRDDRRRIEQNCKSRTICRNISAASDQAEGKASTAHAGPNYDFMPKTVESLPNHTFEFGVGE